MAKKKKKHEKSIECLEKLIKKYIDEDEMQDLRERLLNDLAESGVVFPLLLGTMTDIFAQIFQNLLDKDDFFEGFAQVNKKMFNAHKKQGFSDKQALAFTIAYLENPLKMSEMNRR